MPSFIPALASALLLAAIVTEVVSRFWQDSYLALLAITAIALVLNGLFNARLAARVPAPAAETPKQPERRGSGNKGRERGAKQGDGQRNDKRGDGNRNRGKSEGDRGGRGGRGRKEERTDARREDKRPSAKEATKQEPKEERAPRPEPVRPEGELENGTVKWFNRSKGYGFVVRENGEEIFVHQRSIVATGDRRERPVLRDDQKVSFIVVDHEKGPQAEYVTPL